MPAIEVATVGDEVYSRVRSWITRGVVQPGSRLSIRGIAEEFAVSTMPVREALRRLESDGLVVFARRSVTVAELSVEEVQQVFQIRLRLEQLATEWALPQVDATDLEDLDAILRAMEDPHISQERWRELNQRFHRRFYECADSVPLLDSLTHVWNKVEPYMAIYASRVVDFTEAQRQHQHLMHLIRSRDLSALLAATTEHLAHTAHVVATALNRS